MKTATIKRCVWIILMILFSVLMLVPILMMISTSLKTAEEIHSTTFQFFPLVAQTSNYSDAMQTGDWLRYFQNSLIITGLCVILSLLFNSTAGFAFARLPFRGSKVLFYLILVGLMMPPQVTMLPTFLIMARFPLVGGNDILGSGGSGFINTIQGVIIPLVSGSFGIFLCKQFYENFPGALDEAARIDGAGTWRTYFAIYLPNSKVILATLALLKGVSVWNDYLWPLVMTNSESLRTVQLALTVFRGEQVIQWRLMMAATTVVTIPMIVLFLFTQRFFIRGIITSGLK